MDSVTAKRASLLIMAAFFLQPVSMGAWFALIPVVQAKLGLNKAELAYALLGSPIAIFFTLQVAGRLMARFGPRRIMMLTFPVQGAVVLIPFLTTSWNGLFLAMVLFGMTISFCEIGLNVYSGRLEKVSGRIIMNRCHGFWSLGLMAGAGLMTFFGGVSPFPLLVAIAAVSMALGAFAAFGMPRLAEEGAEGVPPRRKLRELPISLFLIATFMLATTMAEGAMVDWAAVYLAERTGNIGAGAGLAVTIFSGLVAFGRFSGDAIKARFGAVAMARALTTSAALGLLLLILPLPLGFAYAGFGLVGFGIATAFPLGVSATAALGDRHEAGNIAIMSTVALAGFMIGPPMIGTLAEAYSLSLSFISLLPGLILAIWLARWLAPAEGDGIE